ncbi:hypothetical protein [Vulcanococcus sp. Clear-D1]|uniref:hypothetical protein n=1 Tax=Vulcanococcus sp. Clear-D1 TaxID=2766970 RepID=UPI0019AE0D46|nr:hypothetical protein [Vulcanococcus sp. Clear-D1]MBD1192817.1 hypothetical protein [Vulcanococcus sp. Clear-D1]
MPQCSTQAYACFDLINPSITTEQLIAHIESTIQSEVRSTAFDLDSAYQAFADAFDIDDAIDPFLDDHFDLGEYFQLKRDGQTIILEGIPLLNADDHVTRWVAWVLFRQFGAGDVLTFSTETLWADSISRCFYKVSREGQVNTKIFYSTDENDF